MPQGGGIRIERMRVLAVRSLRFPVATMVPVKMTIAAFEHSTTAAGSNCTAKRPFALARGARLNESTPSVMRTITRSRGRKPAPVTIIGATPETVTVALGLASLAADPVAPEATSAVASVTSTTRCDRLRRMAPSYPASPTSIG